MSAKAAVCFASRESLRHLLGSTSPCHHTMDQQQNSPHNDSHPQSSNNDPQQDTDEPSSTNDHEMAAVAVVSQPILPPPPLSNSTVSASPAGVNKRYRPAPAKTFQCRGYGECRMVFSRSEHLARHIRYVSFWPPPNF